MAISALTALREQESRVVSNTSPLGSGGGAGTIAFANVLTGATGSSSQAANIVPSQANSAPSPAGQLDASTLASLLTHSDVSEQSTGTPRLLDANAQVDPWAKPSMAHFMHVTGCDSDTASEVLYGTIGANRDLRDWSAIMSSDNPLADARASTAALHNSELSYQPSETYNPSNDPLVRVWGSRENIEYVESLNSSGTQGQLIFADANGNQLRSISYKDALERDLANFGFSREAVSRLEQQLQAANVGYQRGVWVNGLS